MDRNKARRNSAVPSSQRFMEIFIQPGPSGDITTLMVNQDNRFRRVLDYSYLAPFAVSAYARTA
jgi:hypothetical protein